MSLVTRCPRCSTLFRVTPEQLQLRAGKVRCGRCMNAFDGLQALAAEKANDSAEPARPEPGTAGARVENLSDGATPSIPAPLPPFPGLPGASASSRPSVPRGLPTVTPKLPDEVPVARRVPYPPTAAQMWVAGSCALLLLLALQVAFVYRSELAARSALMKSSFTALCDVAGCAVPLPQRPQLVKIEASDVHMLDANRAGLIQLTATLRSYANYDLAYPALDLVLTNATEHALARRIFVPDEYLDATRDPRKGLSPNAEITVALDLDTADLKASGFRLDLLPAPAP